MNELMARVSHLPTTGAGLALGALAVWVLKSWNCQLPDDSQQWIHWGVGALVAAQGVLSK